MSQGKRLKHLVESLGLTQSEVAERFDIDRSLLSKLYNDKQSISKLFLYALKSEFNINPTWLVTGKGEMFLSDNVFTVEEQREFYHVSGDPRVKHINQILMKNPEMITITDKFLSGSATLKELVEAAEGLPEKRRKVALVQIKALESC